MKDDTRPKAKGSLGWFSLFLGIAILAGVIVVATHFAEEQAFVELARKAEPLWIAEALLLQVVTYLAQAEVWRVVGRKAGADLPLGLMYKLALAKLFIDQALPSAGFSGTVVVAQALERRSLPRATVQAGFVINTTSFFNAYAAALAAALILLFTSKHANVVTVTSSLLFILLSVGVSMTMIALAGRRVPLHRWRILRFPAVQNAIGFLVDADPRLVRNTWLQLETTALQLIIFFLDAATLWVLVRSVGAEASISYVFAAFMVANVVRTVSFIPGGLGTFEAAAVLMLRTGGLSLAAGLSTVLLFRGLTFFLPMVPGLWFSRRLR